MKTPIAIVLLLISIPPAAGQNLPRPLAGHPGNIFLSDEDVDLPAPVGTGALKLLDYDGKVHSEPAVAGGRVRLGRLGVGYYELRREGGSTIALGVLMPLKAQTPATSPIGIDVAMAWFYKPNEMPAVANLCALAGMNWVRDRLNWRDMEKTPGVFTPVGNKYDESARIQSAAGLRVLQVNHIGPAWAKESKRFPDDLRDAYRFHREMARRWRGQVHAFEPWNEADIPMFGGHTGAEMASLQKAAYWGLKDGNPDIIVGQNVFAVDRKATLDDLAANRPWAYLDSMNLHHYIPIDKYAAWYASFRGIGGGRPLWTTEFAMPVQWSGDESLKELSDTDLRRQAHHLVMAFAAALHEGTLAFYFMLPHYVEGKTQFGIIRRDLSPRPAYLALGAVGRLLADARPAGTLRGVEPTVRGYLFRSRPDGADKAVLVAWSTGPAKALAVPGDVFDVLGRPIAKRDEVSLSWSPVFVVMSTEQADKLAVVPPPAAAARIEARPSRVVLQSLGGEARTDVNQSAYRAAAGPEDLAVFAYNFSDKATTISLRAEKPEGWTVELPASVRVEAGGRAGVPMRVAASGKIGAVTIHASAEGEIDSVLSVRLAPK